MLPLPAKLQITVDNKLRIFTFVLKPKTVFIMRSTFLLITIALFTALNSFAQADKILMTVGDQQVSLEEFERIYNKNNVSGVYEKQSVDEYLDLFINFKLKVLEAEKMGLDTATSFRMELKGYRDQLAKPYLNDSTTQEELMKLEYERMKTELHVSHILLRLDPKAHPDDTLLAYRKLITARKEILAGKNFADVAKSISEDPSVAKNEGDIGWLTAFRTVYEFENAAFNTPVNQVSLPIRTQFGYHLIKVWEQRPSKGSVHVAHIFLRAPDNMSPELKAKTEKIINAVYDSLKLNVSFSELAKNNSDDKSTSLKGGELPWFGTGQMIPEFENAAFALKKPGDYSKPVNSFYGWHILQLIESKGLGTYDELRSEIMSKITDTPVSAVKKANSMNKVKTDLNYSLNKENFKKFINLIDTSIYGGQWSDSSFRNNKEILFTIGTDAYTFADFAEYLKNTQKKIDYYSISVFINEKFQVYSEEILLEKQKEMLVNKYPEFKYILKEYHDGILLFDLTDRMVWSKAVEDSVGLEKFYETNKSNYVWEKRANVMVFSSDSLALVDAAKALAVKYGKKKKFSPDFVLSKLCKNDTVKNCIDITEGKYEKGDKQEVDNTNWNVGAGQNYTTDGVTSFVFVRGVLEPEIKKLNEARGLVTADYQNFLEKVWIAELRAKYPVKVDMELLKTVK